MIKVIVVEDEEPALEEIVMELAKFEDINIVGQCGDLFAAMKQIRNHQPDVVFLDLHLPGHEFEVPRSHEDWPAHGFTLLDYLESDEKHPHVVIVSNHTQHALRAIQAHVMDFLPKAELSERLEITIEHLRKQLANPETQANPYPDDLLNHIICRFQNGFKRVPIEEVEYVRANQTGVYVVCVDDNEYYTEMTLKALEQKTKLKRCSKSYLYNHDLVETYVPLENGLAKILIRGHKPEEHIPVSRLYRKSVEICLGIRKDDDQDKDEAIA